MKKMRYEMPSIEVVEFDAADIIRTSGLTTGIGSGSGNVAGSSASSYDDSYNLSAGGKITLN